MTVQAKIPSSATIERLMAHHVGDVRARGIRFALQLPGGGGTLDHGERDSVTRAELALALAGLLFDDVQRRVPIARAYVEDAARAGTPLTFDHGALRTVAADCGALPAGHLAFARLLEPLGYELAATYDLEQISMTGFAYAHADFPEETPQYFVSELHPERFSEGFQAAVSRVVSKSKDPVSHRSAQALERLAAAGSAPFGEAADVLTNLVAAFDRQHEEPTLTDYETLLAESAEMAWISTEGNAFNHATDRVPDVFTVAEQQKRLGRPMKDSVEISANGNVKQTAFRATSIERLFLSPEGHMVVRKVPGSFHEFITRERLEDGSLDLTFDAGNATSIFKMTSAGGDAPPTDAKSA